MENIVDALIMAGQILVFLVALTVCMSSFTKLRQSVYDITKQTEVIQMAKDESGGYINFIEGKSNKAIRVVGAETVIDSMYRAIKEDYEIYIKLNDLDEVADAGVVFWNATKSDATTGINQNDQLIKITIGRKVDNVNEDVNNILSKGLYNIIKDKKFREYLGEYQDLTEGIASENKATKRVITYVES